jgi:hypothetical protein
MMVAITVIMIVKWEFQRLDAFNGLTTLISALGGHVGHLLVHDNGNTDQG